MPAGGFLPGGIPRALPPPRARVGTKVVKVFPYLLPPNWPADADLLPNIHCIKSYGMWKRVNLCVGHVVDATDQSRLQAPSSALGGVPGMV